MAFPPKEKTCERTIANTSVIKLCINPLNPPY